MKRPAPELLLAYAVKLSPRAHEQVQVLAAEDASRVTSRLSRLAAQVAERDRSDRRVRQGLVVGKAFRALYEVDHAAMTVTVLDVSEPD